MISNEKQSTTVKKFLTTGEKNERQTKLSWATPVETYEEVPESFSAFFQPMRQTGKPFPGAVITPGYEGFVHKSPEILLCEMDGCFYFLHKNDSSFETTCLPLSGITCIEFKTVLLDSNLWFCGLDPNGGIVKEHLRFNSVSDYFYRLYIRRARQYAFRGGQPEDFSFLADLEQESFKFTIFCHHSILPGEKVLSMVWQPELRSSIFKRLEPIFHHPVFPSHVALLTNQELILIHETEPQTRNDKYGGTWDYIPIRKIESITLETQKENLLSLNITLIDGAVLQSLYLPGLALKLTGLMDMYHSIIKE